MRKQPLWTFGAMFALGVSQAFGVVWWSAPGFASVMAFLSMLCFMAGCVAWVAREPHPRVWDMREFRLYLSDEVLRQLHDHDKHIELARRFYHQRPIVRQ